MTFKLKNGNTVELVPDQEPPNPRTEWDNVTKIWCFHRRYILGDKHGLRADQFSGFGEFEQYIRDTECPAIIKPLYMYDHSGLTISTSHFHCPWDSGQIGFVFVTQAAVREEGLNPDTLDEMLESEVKTYDQYLRGDVWIAREVETGDSVSGIFDPDEDDVRGMFE